MTGDSANAAAAQPETLKSKTQCLSNAKKCSHIYERQRLERGVSWCCLVLWDVPCTRTS